LFYEKILSVWPFFFGHICLFFRQERWGTAW
jgi:hypothetical protein